MKPKTELLLDKLSQEFGEHGKNSKVSGKKPRIINHRIFLEQVGDGKKLADAVKAAGSKSSSEGAMQVQGSKILKDHPEYREAITEIIEKKQRTILSAMSRQKIEDASLSSQAVAFGILTDKGELLAGRPTSRVEGDVDLSKLEKSALLGYIVGKLSTGGQKRLPGG